MPRRIRSPETGDPERRGKGNWFCRGCRKVERSCLCGRWDPVWVPRPDPRDRGIRAV
jgi:hypothetical protein